MLPPDVSTPYSLRVARDITYRSIGSPSYDRVCRFSFFRASMPLSLNNTAPSLAIRRSAFERANLTRQAFDETLGLTPDEFRMELG